MSWDVILLKTASNKENYDDITAKNAIPFKTNEIINTLEAFLPGINTDDSSWLYFDDGKNVLELSLSQEKQITLHIHKLENPENFIGEICKMLQCRAFDTASGLFMS